MTPMKPKWRWLNISKVEDEQYIGLEAVTAVIMKSMVLCLEPG
jgi:hypothetical protein